MALNGIQIFKLTPKKNCKECGCPTCMAFSMKVAQGAMKSEQCPHMSDEALASLSEATAPPMKTIKIGTGDGEFTLGGETVLFRHEKTFVSKPRYAVALCTCMDDATVEAKLAEIPKVDYDRIGERMYAEIVYVNCDAEATADKYVALVQKAAALSQGDATLQMPIITPVASETWGVKESVASEADMPEWGSEDERGIDMEVMTAAADLAAGSDAVILRHPQSVKTIAKMIDALV